MIYTHHVWQLRRNTVKPVNGQSVNLKNSVWKKPEWNHSELWGLGIKKFYAAMTSPQYMPLIAYPKAWTPGLEGILKGNAILMDIKTEADLDTFKGKLKVLLFFPEVNNP